MEYKYKSGAQKRKGKKKINEGQRPGKFISPGVDFKIITYHTPPGTTVDREVCWGGTRVGSVVQLCQIQNATQGLQS